MKRETTQSSEHPVNGQRTALISGASRGVGLALARALADQGYNLAITARGAERLAQAQAELEARGATVVAEAGDVSSWRDCERLVDAALDRFGRLDLVVNNAGVSMRGEFADLSEEVCARTLSTNLGGAVALSRLTVEPLMATRGSLIFVSSIAGLFGLPGASTYCASKGALTGLCESLRLELLPLGVHVGIAYLGFTEHDPEKRILAADGTAVLPDRPAHHTQAQAAAAILGMVRRRQRRLVLTPVGRLGDLAYRLSPTLVEQAILLAQRHQAGIFRAFA